MFGTILAAASRLPARAAPMGGGWSIIGLITPIATLLITVGVFYVLIKLGNFIDALKEKTEAEKK
jgi:hypothetical protein